MSESVGGRLVRKRRSRIEVEKLVAEFEASGQTREAYCIQRGLSVAALDRYRRRRHEGRPSGPGRMIAVQVNSRIPQAGSSDGEQGAALLVELRSGRRIEVRRGFDGATLERLLTLLDQG